MKPATVISLCKVQLGLKQNTFTQLTISDHLLNFVETSKCDLISKFARWLNFEFSINSDLKYIKYSSRNWFIISNQSSFTFIICSFFGFWVVQNGSEVQKSSGQAGIDSVLNWPNKRLLLIWAQSTTKSDFDKMLDFLDVQVWFCSGSTYYDINISIFVYHWNISISEMQQYLTLIPASVRKRKIENFLQFLLLRTS